MKNILIYGASGHAKMIVDIIHRNNDYTLIGFLDSLKPMDKVVYGYNILGDLDQLPYLIEELNIEGIIIGIGENSTRRAAYHKIKEIAPQLEFVSVIHPSATIATDVSIVEGTVIMANVVINADAQVGRFCILNTASTLGHDCQMADFSSLASGATIGGNVQIGVCSAICLGARVIHDLKIGDHTVIGAGSIVLKSIGDNKTAFGTPINIIKDRCSNSTYLSKQCKS